jgi:tripartite-type tricarboxylate transporter receptor subunit TctC
MDPAVTRKINEAVNEILAKPAIRERFQSLGAAPGGGSPDVLGRRVSDEIKQWGEVVKFANIQPQ